MPNVAEAKFVRTAHQTFLPIFGGPRIPPPGPFASQRDPVEEVVSRFWPAMSLLPESGLDH